jgi:MFS family permease
VTGRLGSYLRSFTGFSRDARLFLLTTLVSGAAISLYWTDFNLYLAALGIDRSTIGLIAAMGSLAGAVVAFPASGLSDRFGRRAVLVGGVVLMILATLGFIASSTALVLGLLTALYGAGQQAFFVVQSPYMTEHSRPEHRNELFSLQFAITTGTNVFALMVGGAIAQIIGANLGFAPGSAGVYRIILVLMTIALLVSLGTLALLVDDRPARQRRNRPSPTALGEPAAFPPRPRSGFAAARLGSTIVDRGRFARLVLPGFLIALGAGQIIPFLNLFIEEKFGLDLAQLNVVFAITSLGTMLAILLQPALARRMGKVNSVVVVQAASIPFLVALGFSPVLWTVVIAMAVRNSLMNAGNPISNAFAMEHVHPSERATLAAAMSELWSIGWVVAGFWYAILQGLLGFTGGYTVGFITIITLYSIGTFLYWHWFHGVEARERAAARAIADVGPA